VSGIAKDGQNYIVPARLDGPDGEIGEIMTTVTPDDPDWVLWDEWWAATHPRLVSVKPRLGRK